MQLLLLLVSSVVVATTTYEGCRVYQIWPQTQEEIDFLGTLKEDGGFDFWNHPRGFGGTIDVMVVPERQNTFERHLKMLGSVYSIKIGDVGRLIKEQEYSMGRVLPQPTNRLSFDVYHRHDVINTFLRQLAKDHPKIVSVETVGKSYEGRELLAVKISDGGGTKPKPAILIDGGIHAREWIAPATVLYIIDQLVLNSTNSDLYKSVDWYLLPVLNPDGYEFSHTTSRLWRKTRNPGKTCIGADANRNFDYEWGTIGSSTNECSETYRGSKAFSEVESLSIANYARKYSNVTKLYLSFHSYGQLLMYPWGYTNSAPDNGKELQALGDAVKDAIKRVNGTTYTVGYSYITIYPTSGSSVDYARGALNIPLTYTLELPDKGYGFVLPPQFIKGVVVETFEGVRVFGKYVTNNYGEP